MLIARAHSFLWVAEFWAEPRNFPFTLEFWYFGRISWNFAEIRNLSAISTIFDLMTYFCHGKNQTDLPKAMGHTDSCHNMAQSQINAMQLDRLHF